MRELLFCSSLLCVVEMIISKEMIICKEMLISKEMIIPKENRGPQASGLVGLWDYLKWDGLPYERCYHISGQNQNERIASVQLTFMCSRNDYSLRNDHFQNLQWK